MRSQVVAIVALFCMAAPALADTAAPTPPPQPRNARGGHFPMQGGEAIYKGVCQGCHMPDAKGAVGAGRYPALANNPNLETAGYPIVLVKPLIRHSTSHQCGTVKFGVDPTTSAIDPYCRSHQHANLFVIDASFMVSSAAVNPALTIVAQALRATDHMLKEDFGTPPQHAA